MLVRPAVAPLTEREAAIVQERGNSSAMGAVCHSELTFPTLSSRFSLLTMLTRLLKPSHGPHLIVRPLRNGDVETVSAVFARLGDASRRMRFNGPKPCLSDVELAELARIDPDHHALVGYIDGDARPVAIARLARDGRGAEIA